MVGFGLAWMAGVMAGVGAALGVAALAEPDLMIEVEATAVLP